MSPAEVAERVETEAIERRRRRAELLNFLAAREARLAARRQRRARSLLIRR